MILIPLDVYVIMLLTGGLVSTVLVAQVVRRQLQLFKMPIRAQTEQEEKTLVNFRRMLFGFSLAYLVLGIFPILLNAYTLFYDTGRPPFVPLPSFIFTMCLQGQLLVLSLMLNRMYKPTNARKKSKDIQ